ncbi:diguanylate cyclase [Falsigemmobacter intermedius]|uniref:GGDEF domain-containing protein n=1 Tax=Falsigemmobacter intermedius TaxID=1553448 RepID=UPI003F0AA3A9
MDQDQLFLLMVPACLLVLALLLMACRLLLNRHGLCHLPGGQEYLPLTAMSFLCVSVALTLQTLLSNAGLADRVVLLALLHVIGALALHQAICLRFDLEPRHRLAVGIAVLTVTGSYYFGEMRGDLLSRLTVVSAGVAAILCLSVPDLLRQREGIGLCDRLLATSYVFGAGFAVLRSCWTIVIAPGADLEDLPGSGPWKLYLALMLFFKLWLTVVVVLVAIGDLLASLRRQRDTDPLSGLLNRRGFQEQAELRLRQHPGANWHLIAVDLDHFKRINDCHGHHTGDLVIRQLSDLFARHLRPGQIAGRMGGEEFMLMIDAATLAQAVSLAETLRRAVEGATWPDQARVTASFGVEQVADAADFHVALRRVDMLLYEAKNQGRNRVSAAAAALAAVARAKPCTRPEAPRALPVAEAALASAR